ncbi:MAG: UDP-N-acetylmuramate dehydrogenase [Pseudomonadota bacterium]|nr:UDP-N-acetylmuramate dehydrogenase [Pseudomonadota bacterium]
MSASQLPYRVIQNAPLQQRNTFGIAAHASQLIEVFDSAALPEVFASHPSAASALVLGGGSNVLFARDPGDTIIVLNGSRIEIIDDLDGHAVVRADAGADWHTLVMWTLQQGLSGLENLALIPGTVGAAPIQNIGAYGVEVRDCIHAVEAFERATGQWQRLDREACGFSYRDSLFKRQADRFIVTAVEFVLAGGAHVNLEYAGIADELTQMGVTAPSPAQVAEAVIRLRRRKLPDPAVIGNAGSFFKNPILSNAQAGALQREHASLPMFSGSNEAYRKLSAAWLIDACGWKGHRDGDAGVSDKHALVLVNHGRATGAQILDLARRIADSVQSRFGVALEPEPRVVGAAW